MRIIKDSLALKWERHPDRHWMEYAYEATGNILFEMAAGDMLTTNRVYEAIRENDDMRGAADMLKAGEVEWEFRIITGPELYELTRGSGLTIQSNPDTAVVLVEVVWDSTSDIPQREVERQECAA